MTNEEFRQGMIDRLLAAKRMIRQQAEDEGLWFRAQTASEAYLQQELRKLHSVIEGTAP